MNKTLSPQQVRLVALLALLAAVAVAWWMLVARQASETSSSPAAVPRTHDARGTRRRRPPRPRSRHSRGRRRSPPQLATHGLPQRVAQALRKHRVVVVALYTPGAVLDKLAGAESEAAAKSSGAGFVSLDVFRQKEGGPILRKLGVVDAPAVLVVRRPATVFDADRRLRRPQDRRAGRRQRAPMTEPATPLCRRAGAARAVRPQREQERARGRDDEGARLRRRLRRRCPAGNRPPDEERSIVQLRRRTAGEHVRDGGSGGADLPRLRDPRMRKEQRRVEPMHDDEAELADPSPAEPGADVIALPQLERLPPKPGLPGVAPADRLAGLDIRSSRLEALELVRSAVELADRIERDAKESARGLARPDRGGGAGAAPGSPRRARARARPVPGRTGGGSGRSSSRRDELDRTAGRPRRPSRAHGRSRRAQSRRRPRRSRWRAPRRTRFSSTPTARRRRSRCAAGRPPRCSPRRPRAADELAQAARAGAPRAGRRPSRGRAILAAGRGRGGRTPVGNEPDSEADPSPDEPEPAEIRRNPGARGGRRSRASRPVRASRSSRSICRRDRSEAPTPADFHAAPVSLEDLARSAACRGSVR